MLARQRAQESVVAPSGMSDPHLLQREAALYLRNLLFWASQCRSLHHLQFFVVPSRGLKPHLAQSP
ncbi:uncharacterized protein PG986_005203 [Apiospora aurea]|uniref:Uncharacterized protein n=1 Tax=Apiospora aurea TaxID=335848 RepID=A0ABR1QGV8_9PEZI